MAGLDDLLGSLTKQGAGSGGSGLEDLLGGLLGGSEGADSGAAQGGLGGFGDVLGGILGGGRGGGGSIGTSAGGMNMGMIVAALAPLIAKLVKNGGLSKMVSNAHASGLSAQADSWVGTSENAAVGSHEVRQVVGDDAVAELAQNAGISHDEAAEVLARVVPQVVSGLTPDGEVPADDDLDQLVARFGG